MLVIHQHGTMMFKRVDLSKGYVKDIEKTCEVPNANLVRPIVQLYVEKKSTSEDPTGILLTGAHLWVISKGSTAYKTEQVPCETKRNVYTERTNCNPSYTHPRYIAKNYDSVVADSAEYTYFPMLRALNPNIKIYLYEAADATNHNNDVQWELAPLESPI